MRLPLDQVACWLSRVNSDGVESVRTLFSRTRACSSAIYSFVAKPMLNPEISSSSANSGVSSPTSGLPGRGSMPKILFSSAVNSIPSFVVSSSVTSRIWMSIHTCPRTKSNLAMRARTSGRYRCSVVTTSEFVFWSAKTVTLPRSELISFCSRRPPVAKNRLKLKPLF